MPNTITQFSLFCRRRRRCRVHFPQLAESTTGKEEEEHPEQNPTQRETLCTIRIPIQRCLQPHQHHHRRQPLGEGFARTHRSAFKDGKRAPKWQSTKKKTTHVNETKNLAPDISIPFYGGRFFNPENDNNKWPFFGCSCANTQFCKTTERRNKNCCFMFLSPPSASPSAYVAEQVVEW